MEEILNSLPASARVLDLGSRTGSFDSSRFAFLSVRVDLDPPPQGARADAALLPFPNATFDAIIANHSLEHFKNLDAALSEIARVLRTGGAFYAAVPDSTTFTDRLYRWLAQGGGHVNPFPTAPDLIGRITRATGLPHRATRTLYTSLSFLNRRNAPGPTPRRLWLFGGGWEPALLVLSAALRLLDRWFGTRASVYGWAVWFGNVPPVDPRARVNVCLRCGAGHDCGWLVHVGAVRACFYHCPGCGVRNFFCSDSSDST